MKPRTIVSRNCDSFCVDNCNLNRFFLGGGREVKRGAVLWKNFDKIIEGIELKISRCLEVDESGKLRGRFSRRWRTRCVG